MRAAMEILKICLSTSVLITAIVIIRALMLQRLPKRTFLVLWGIVLCRLLVPLSIPSRYSIYNLVDSLQPRSFTVGTHAESMNVFYATATEQITATAAQNAALIVSPFQIVWLTGLLACASFFLANHLRCLREYKTALPVESELVTSWTLQHPLRRKVRVQQSDRVAAPLTYGILRPVVLLPGETDWGNETQLRHVLAHEYTHIQRFDILAKYLLAAALCIYWFDPFVWAMYVLANRDIELSCDEAVVRMLGETKKSDYAMTLIGLAETKSRVSPLVNNFSKNAIEERIISIMKIKKASIVTIIAAAIIVTGTTTVFATVSKNNTGNRSSAADSALSSAASPVPYAAASSGEAAQPTAKPVSKDALPKYWDMGALNENGIPYLALVSTAESLGYTVNVEKHDVKDADYIPGCTNVVEYNYEIMKAGKSLGIASIDVADGKVVQSLLDGIYRNTHDRSTSGSIILKDNVVYMSAQFFKEAIDNGNVLP